MNELTQELLRELFDYRDGKLYWAVSQAKQIKIGDHAGNVNLSGYRQIMINDKRYYTHRLIFLYHHGFLPQFLDHIDGDRSNNDILNLREATKQENSMNRKKCEHVNGKPTSSKYKGVSWKKCAKKWQTHIQIYGKRKHIGYFDSEIEAALAYNQATTKLFGEFAKLNEIDQNLYKG